MAEGPEDQVLESIWACQSSGDRFSIPVGEVTVPITAWIVWFPFLVILLLGWIGLVVFLPSNLSGSFMEFTFAWLRLASGEFSGRVLGSFVGTIGGVLLGFVLYTRVYSWVVGSTLRILSNR